MAKFKATTSVQGDETTLHLEGLIDGSVDFKGLIRTPPKRLTVDCSRVLHANSSLVKPWIECFRELVARGTSLSFAGCPPTLVEYMNFVNGFRCGGKVVSVEAPFFCKRCNRSYSTTLETRDRASVDALIETQKCLTCFGPAVFDENAEEFFTFLG